MKANKNKQVTAGKEVSPKLAKNWAPFRERLIKILSVLEEDQFLIISLKQTSRYVQFAGQGSFGMRVETVSNQYLPANERLDPKQMKALRKLGWNKPTGSAKQSTPKKDPDGSANYHVDFAAPVPVEKIAALAIATFAGIHDAPYPGNLEYEAFDDEGNRLELSQLGLKRHVRDTNKDGAADQTVLRTKLRGTLRALTGDETLDFDDDGDIGVRYGSMMAFARLVEEGPTVHIFAPLVQKISTNPPLMEKLNAINVNNLRMKLFVHNDTVYGVANIPVLPYIGDLVAREFSDFCKSADELDNLLQGEFGGRTAFYEWTPSTSRH